MRGVISGACAVLAALALGACGDEDDASSAGTATTTATTSSATTSTSTTSTFTDETGLPREPCPGAESPPNIVNVVSYGTDCGAVEDAMAELKSVSRSFRIGDFECSRVSGTALSGTWECRGEASYFVFDFGD